MIFNTENFIEQQSLNKVKFYLLFLSLITSLFQMVISNFSLEAIQILVIINISSLLTYNITLKKQNLIINLVGSLMIIAFNIYYFFGPLFIKTILLQEITSNLSLPIKSFTLSLFFQISVLLAYITLLKLDKINKNVDYKKNILFRLKAFNYFDLKSTMKLFMILLIVKIYLNLIDRFGTITDFGNIIYKFLFGIELFYYLPIIFYFNLYFHTKTISKKRFVTFLFINFILFILFALLSNSRSQMVLGFFIIFYNFFIIFIFSKDKNYQKNIKYFVILILFLSIIFQGLSNTILQKRDLYNVIKPLDMLKFSLGLSNLEVPDNPTQIKENPEEYSGIGVLDRITIIKYFDKTLFESSFLSTSQISEFKNFEYMKMISILPQNLIKVFNKNYDKKTYLIGSGSYIEQKAGFRYGGNFNKGSILTEIILITNSYLLTFLILYSLYLLIFKIITKFQFRDKNFVTYSPILILVTYDFINFVNAGNFLTFFNLTIRMPIQYLIIYYLVNLFLNKSQNKTNI